MPKIIASITSMEQKYQLETSFKGNGIKIVVLKFCFKFIGANYYN